MSVAIRDAEDGDADAVARIYRPFVEATHVSFEERAPDVDEMRRRIATYKATHAFLVADDGEVAGFAYGSPVKPRDAYRWSAETTVYVEETRRGSGVGRALYRALLQRLRERGMRSAFAAIALPNEASEALHRAAGFEHVGTLERIGFKAGAWRDVAWWQLHLDRSDDPPR